MVASAIWEHMAAMVAVVSALTWVLGLFARMRVGRRLAASASAIVVLSLVPVGGLSVVDLVLSFSPSLSVAGTALWAALLVRRLSGVDPVGGRGMAGLALLVTAVALPVYASTIGGLGVGLYGSGYGYGAWDWVLAASAMAMFISGSRIALVLLACLAAHAAGLMRSSNIFDTLIDLPALMLSAPLLFRAAFPRRDPLIKRGWL